MTLALAILLACSIPAFCLKLVREVLSDLLKRELQAALPDISYSLVRRAALLLPRQHRGELEAWESELHEYADRPLRMLMTAAQIWRHRKAIAGEAALAIGEPRTAARWAVQVRLFVTAPGARSILAAQRGLQRLRQLLQAKLDLLSVGFSLAISAYMALGWYETPALYRSLGMTALLPSSEVRLALYGITLAELLKRRQRLITIVRSALSDAE